MAIYISGKNSWEVELTYETSFTSNGSNAGTSVIDITAFRLHKGSNTTEASTASGTVYLYINGIKTSIGSYSLRVPAGGDWSPSYSCSWSGRYSPGTTISVGFDDPWNNLYSYNASVNYITAQPYPTYTISYNANGGSGTVASQTKTWGTPLYLRNGGYTRTGYNLLGWSTNSAATSPTYYVGDDAQARKYTSESGATMYAIWEAANPQFSASFTTQETVIDYASFTLTAASNVSCQVKQNSTIIATKTLGTNVTTVSAGSITSANWASGKSVQPLQNYTIVVTAINSANTSFSTTHEYSVTTRDYPKIVNFTADSIEAGSARSLTIYNPLGRAYTIQAKIGNTVLGEVNDATHNKGETLAKQITLGINAACSAIGGTARSGTVQYSIIASEPSTHTSTSTTWQDTVRLTQDNAAPSIDNTKINAFISCLDSVSNVINASGSSSKLFKDKSKLKVRLVSSSNPFTTKANASLNTNYTISFNNKSITTAVVNTDYYEGSDSITNSSANAVVINSTAYTVTVTATDSRDFTATISKVLTIYNYTTPAVTISKIYRDDGYGSAITIEPSITWCANMSNIANNTVQVYYKKTTDPNYTGPISKTISNGKIAMTNIDSGSAYLFYIIATDTLSGTGTSATVSLSVGTPPVFIDVEKNALGINYLPEAKGLFIDGVEQHPGALVGLKNAGYANYWFKVASLSTTATNADPSISFKVSQNFADSNTKLGVLTAHVRTDGSGYWNNSQLTWEYALSGINPSHFVLAHNESANPTIVELWAYQPSTYCMYHFDVITSGTRFDRYCDDWVLEDQINGDGVAAITSGLTQQESTVGSLYGYNKIYSGAVNPDASLGAVGDLYILI